MVTTSGSRRRSGRVVRVVRSRDDRILIPFCNVVIALTKRRASSSTSSRERRRVRRRRRQTRRFFCAGAKSELWDGGFLPPR